MNEFAFDAESHTYRLNGEVIPSVTQILKSVGLVNYDAVAKDVLEHKRKIGKAVHLACEYYDKKELDSVPESYAGYVEAYKKFSAYRDWDYIEQPMLGTCNGMNYGMTADRVGVLSGQHVILEIKASAQEEPWWRLQLMAYAAGTKRLGYKRKAVQLKEDGTFKLYSYDDMKDLSIWNAALALATWKINNGGRI